MQVKMIFWQALTPVHPGTGQDSSSVIDLPVAREAATKFPVIPASSLKGVLRDGREDEGANRIFGSLEKAAELTLTDARVLFLPVRSYAGTFAFLTCPLVLERLGRDQKALGLPGLQAPIPTPQQTEALLPQESEIVHNGQVILEDIDLTAKPGAVNDLAKELGQRVFGPEAAYFQKRFALVSNDVFSYFCETALEIIARVRLNSDSKTVERGGLWYEEAIPAETVFSSFAIGTDGFEELDRSFIQLGGQASVGRGLLRRLGGGV
ncbi:MULTISPECIES: type III-B CRISPR module RAMP protein Cmr4 [unclassified Meiothermus]|uniref:type III-B CRISPR module RAMP protein Cmr4 n=1 Tax=unclassified Meiothermus TaxID=370471 RepID=UPI000D7CA068|nr:MULTISPECIES: type III-B CRISPR module RAMP protein Cmr4 [unclassified Meiothermus]PZA08064.1 type III-B CRISPR module RAMP protein Cmr4 [Meiothermus sp. Pnk-1]RYM34501.1 type III-B CRISPR module RAMP protein Cmr4 [Meiothermus sp. PNK-Is4]